TLARLKLESGEVALRTCAGVDAEDLAKVRGRQACPPCDLSHRNVVESMLVHPGQSLLDPIGLLRGKLGRIALPPAAQQHDGKVVRHSPGLHPSQGQPASDYSLNFVTHGLKPRSTQIGE